MHRDWNLAGIYLAPISLYLVIALAILLLLRPLLTRLHFAEHVLNAPLAEAGLYVCLLAILVSVF